MTNPSYTSLSINDKPLVDSWSCPDPYLEPNQTDMEGGNKRLRRRPGDNVTRYTFDILLTNAEFTTFRNFVDSTLGGGISRFTMRVWDGSAMVSKTVQFATRYLTAPLPPLKIKVTFDIWVYPA